VGKRSADWLGHHNKRSDWSNPVGGVVCLGFYARKTWLFKRGGFFFARGGKYTWYSTSISAAVIVILGWYDIIQFILACLLLLFG